MQKDERKIQDRNPKRQLISEEKWSEGTNWNDLVQEGAERELVYLAEEERKVKERESETDKALRIMVQGTEVIQPIIPPSPLPTCLCKKTYGPKQGGPIFEELLKTSTKVYDLVSASGRNIASMISSMTILVGKEACAIEKIRKMKIKIQEDGENYL